MPAPVPVLITVPHLNRTASPYRETIAMARYLPGDEFALTICCLRDKGYEETAPQLAGCGVRSFVAPFRPTGRTPGHVVRALRAQRRVDAAGPFVIHHSLDFTSSPFEGLMARARSRLFLYNQRNLNEHGHDRLLRIKTLLAHRIIGISGAVMEFLERRRIPRAKLHRIHLGIDLPEIESRMLRGVPRQAGHFLFVGQFERRKHHDDAIRALALVARDHPEARLAIAGNCFDQPYLDELHHLVRELDLAGRVEFLGVRTDIPELMQRSHAVLLCSDSEAFGWVILEAMATGTPMISSAVDGPREIIENGRTGLLVPPRDVAGFAAAMRALLRNPELGCTLGHNARRVVAERFSAASMVENTKDVYRDLLQSSR